MITFTTSKTINQADLQAAIAQVLPPLETPNPLNYKVSQFTLWQNDNQICVMLQPSAVASTDQIRVIVENYLISL